MVNEPLMLISSWGALHLSTHTPSPTPLPLETQDPASQCNHSPGPRLSESGELAPLARPGCCRCFSSYARKGSNAKTNVFITSNRSGRAGHPAVGWGVGVRWEQWQAASGNFALHHDSHHPAAILTASITPGSESCLLASPEDTAGIRQGLSPKTTSQPTTT